MLRRSILQRHPANTRRSEFVIVGIDHIRGAQSFISRFLPLGDQCGIDQSILNAVIVDLFADFMVRVVHVVDVSGALPAYLVDGPHAFGVAFSGVGFPDFVAEFIFEGGENRGEVGEAFGWFLCFGIPAVGRHGLIGYCGKGTVERPALD